MSDAKPRSHAPPLEWAPRGDPSTGHSALLTRLERRSSASSDDAEDVAEDVADADASVPRWIERLLRTPLPAKLFGANMLLLIAATATALVARDHELNAVSVLTVVIVAFFAALLLNTALVMLAVRPLRVLEKTVDTIWRGNLNARVPISVLADRHVMRVSRMLNILLDGLVADRARTRRLATEIISAADTERAAISRELHDSAAQSLAALVMQLSVAVSAADSAPPDAVKERIEAARTLAINTLEEVRLLAHTMHPRVLDDLGLIAALRRLARDTSDHLANRQPSSEGSSAATVRLVAQNGSDEDLPASVKSVLYRVAQEAVQNALRHANATRIEIRLYRDSNSASVEITDDGRGFDADSMLGERVGIGLFTMRERIDLVDGKLRIRSRPGEGTSVLASVPLHPALSGTFTLPDS